ncbi:response regulator transcription factor [Achromobacter denitrificans]
MNNTLDVIFLCHDDARHASLAEALSHLGFNVRHCQDLAKVYERYFHRPCSLIILEAPLPDIHNAAVRLRAADNGLGIVAISGFPDAESRIRTLLCGADACLPTDVTGLELAATLQALVRRAAAQESPDAVPDAQAAGESTRETWRLANKGWTLVSPAGRTLGLTTGERDFLSRMVNSPDRKVGRDAFHADGVDETGNGLGRRRFMDVMISRLRRKAVAQQMSLPIRAVHGWGYMFAANITFDSNFKEAGAAGRADAPGDWRGETAEASS